MNEAWHSLLLALQPMQLQQDCVESAMGKLDKGRPLTSLVANELHTSLLMTSTQDLWKVAALRGSHPKIDLSIR